MNTGAGTLRERIEAALYLMIHSQSPVTRHVCRKIVAKRIAETFVSLEKKK